MKKEIREQLPKWANFNDGVVYDLVNTDDLDGVMSCRVMEKILDYKVGYFYDFKTLYLSETNIGSNAEKLYLDCATTVDKSIDNHVQAISYNDTVNYNSVNLNNIGRYYGCTNDYYNKYCGSSLLTVMSLLNMPIPEDEETQMILLAIDSTFLGYYSSNNQYKQSNRSHLLYKLQFEELYNLQGRKTASDFYKITDKYNLKAKIKVVDGKLQYTKDISILRQKLIDTMGLDIALPTEEFIIEEQFEELKHYKLPENADLKKWTKENLFNSGIYIHSLAMTRQREISCSYNKIAI